MHLIKFIVFKLKRLIIPAFICMFLLFLIIYSRSNLEAARAGLNLWAVSIIPSLFPFFIATELLGYTKVIAWLGKLFHKIMKPVFNVPRRRYFCNFNGYNKWLPRWSENCC